MLRIYRTKLIKNVYREVKYTTHECIHFIDMCDDMTCQNGGTCRLNEGKPFCECAVAYVGDYCEKCKYMSNFKLFSNF